MRTELPREPSAFWLEVFVCPQHTMYRARAGSHLHPLPPDHLSLPRTECLLLSFGLVSSRDERELPALRMTSYFLPGLCCPEQVGFSLSL